MVAVEVRQRADSTTTKDEEEEEEEENEEEAEEVNIKSNNPHLTGGELDIFKKYIGSYADIYIYRNNIHAIIYLHIVCISICVYSQYT